MNITQEILSDLVVYNKYAKYVPKKQRRETWDELVTRNKEMHQEKFPQLKEKIPFLVGIICGGIKSKFFTDYLSQKSGITTNYSKQEYRIKDARSTSSDYSFGAFDILEKFHQMKKS